MDEGTRILPGLPPVAGKPVPRLAFDGGRMTSMQDIVAAAIEQRLKIAERLAACIERPARSGTGGCTRLPR